MLPSYKSLLLRKGFSKLSHPTTVRNTAVQIIHGRTRPKYYRANHPLENLIKPQFLDPQDADQQTSPRPASPHSLRPPWPDPKKPHGAVTRGRGKCSVSPAKLAHGTRRLGYRTFQLSLDHGFTSYFVLFCLCANISYNKLLNICTKQEMFPTASLNAGPDAPSRAHLQVK